MGSIVASLHHSWFSIFIMFSKNIKQYLSLCVQPYTPLQMLIFINAPPSPNLAPPQWKKKPKPSRSLPKSWNKQQIISKDKKSSYFQCFIFFVHLVRLSWLVIWDMKINEVNEKPYALKEEERESFNELSFSLLTRAK